jgi:hypothetical protein
MISLSASILSIGALEWTNLSVCFTGVRTHHFKKQKVRGKRVKRGLS